MTATNPNIASDAILEHYRLRAVRRTATGGWSVDSKSGNTYLIRTTTHIDRESGSMFFRTHCTCPARRTCRHISAILDIRHNEALSEGMAGDSTAMDILEREEL